MTQNSTKTGVVMFLMFHIISWGLQTFHSLMHQARSALVSTKCLVVVTYSFCQYTCGLKNVKTLFNSQFSGAEVGPTLII